MFLCDHLHTLVRHYFLLLLLLQLLVSFIHVSWEGRDNSAVVARGAESNSAADLEDDVCDSQGPGGAREEEEGQRDVRTVCMHACMRIVSRMYA